MIPRILLICFLFINISLINSYAASPGTPQKVLSLKAPVIPALGRFKTMQAEENGLLPTSGTVLTNACEVGKNILHEDGAGNFDWYFCADQGVGFGAGEWTLVSLGGLWEENDSPVSPSLPVKKIWPKKINDKDDLYFVGVGTNEPLAKLHIVGNDDIIGPNAVPYASLPGFLGRPWTGLRLDSGDPAGGCTALSEIRTHNLFNGQWPIFSIYSGKKGCGLDDEESYRVSVTHFGAWTFFDNYLSLPSPFFSPTVNIQRNLDPNVSPLIINTNEVDTTELASVYSFNTRDVSFLPTTVPPTEWPGDKDSIGFGFSVDIAAPALVGAAIIHERIGDVPNYMGKLHFATKGDPSTTLAPAGIYPAGPNPEMPIPIRMTIDNEGEVGIGTMDPKSKLHITGINDTPIQPEAKIILQGQLGAGNVLGTLEFQDENDNPVARIRSTRFGGALPVVFVNLGNPGADAFWFTNNAIKGAASAGGALLFQNQPGTGPGFETAVSTPTDGQTHTRILRGYINGLTGVIIQPSGANLGYTATRLSTGLYQIDFDTPFSADPIITATAMAPASGTNMIIAMIDSVSTSSVTIQMRNASKSGVIVGGGGAAAGFIDNDFMFQIIGEK